MKKETIYVVLAALLGAGVGAFLSYGPLKQYKSEAVLNIELDSYKQLDLFVKDPVRFNQYIAHTKPNTSNEGHMMLYEQDVMKADWLKPVPRFDKTDNIEQENYKKRELDLVKEFKNIFGENAPFLRSQDTGYTGLRIMSFAKEPQIAVDKVNWLSEYALDAAKHISVDFFISKLLNENKLFTDHYEANMLRQEFATEQLKLKITTLKKSLANYPLVAKSEIENGSSAGRIKINSLTPQAQMLAAELNLLEIETTNRRLHRAKSQQIIVDEVTQKLTSPENLERSGLYRLKYLDELLNDLLKNTEMQSQREKLLLMQVDVSNIKARLVKKPAFLFQASTPTPQGPSPLKVIILCSVFLSFLMSIIVWRKAFMKHLIQDANTFSIQNKQ